MNGANSDSYIISFTADPYNKDKVINPTPTNLFRSNNP
jgi:hypothetical protein